MSSPMSISLKPRTHGTLASSWQRCRLVLHGPPRHGPLPSLRARPPEPLRRCGTGPNSRRRRWVLSGWFLGDLGVSINGATAKWMVYRGKSMKIPWKYGWFHGSGHPQAWDDWRVFCCYEKYLLAITRDTRDYSQMRVSRLEERCNSFRLCSASSSWRHQRIGAISRAPDAAGHAWTTTECQRACQNVCQIARHNLSISQQRCQIKCQNGCLKRCQTECQNRCQKEKLRQNLFFFFF